MSNERILKARARLGVAARSGGDVAAARRDLEFCKAERALTELARTGLSGEERAALTDIIKNADPSGGLDAPVRAGQIWRNTDTGSKFEIVRLDGDTVVGWYPDGRTRSVKARRLRTRRYELMRDA